METRLWTIHDNGSGDLKFVADEFSWLALVLTPVWAIWNGYWITLAVYIGLVGIAGGINPLAASPVAYGLALILAFDGAEIIRAELSMRGWIERGSVEARTEEGAEELFVTGRAA
ncbi:MAG: DUF2628 domain-containing protein [Pseudomonadota bacterium]